MPKLPESLDNRFNLYLNILPVVDSIGQLLCLLAGICLLTIAIVKASMSLSKSIQSNHNTSQKYSHMHKYLGTDSKIYEMTEKCIITNDGLCDIDLNDEKNYMLEQEPALSEDDEVDSDTKSLKSSSYEEDETDGSLKLVSKFCSFNDICIILHLMQTADLQINLFFFFFFTFLSNRTRLMGSCDTS